MTRYRFAESTAGRAGSTGPAIRAGFFALALLLTVAPTVSAQSSGKGFLFDQPRWTFGIRGGFDRAVAGSDIFTFMTDTLTLEKSDFGGFTVSADLAYAITPRVDLAVGAGFVRSEKLSEFREYIGTDDLPINQTTTFSRLPVTATVKAYLYPRGRSIGSLAWIPTRFSPYLGLGGGALYYEFLQEGEFVDTEEGTDVFDVFYDQFESSGWTPTAHGLLGAEFALTPRLGISTEGRYTWAKSEMSADFVNFDRIDLSGFSATMGFTIRF